MGRFEQKKALRAIDREGVVLLYPHPQGKGPHSLWREFFPRKKMRWEWSDAGDDAVADLWHFREKLSRSRKCVYIKYFQNRASFVSLKLYTALLQRLHFSGFSCKALSEEAQKILDCLLESSPQSSKELRKKCDLKGKFFERSYQNALRELWKRFLIVGFGEIDDGAFPSLGIAASELIFEELWSDARTLDTEKSKKMLQKKIPPDSAFGKYFIHQNKKFLFNPASDSATDGARKSLPPRTSRELGR